MFVLCSHSLYVIYHLQQIHLRCIWDIFHFRQFVLCRTSVTCTPCCSKSPLTNARQSHYICLAYMSRGSWPGFTCHSLWMEAICIFVYHTSNTLKLTCTTGHTQPCNYNYCQITIIMSSSAIQGHHQGWLHLSSYCWPIIYDIFWRLYWCYLSFPQI